MAEGGRVVDCCLQRTLVVREGLGRGTEGEAGTKIVARAWRDGCRAATFDNAIGVGGGGGFVFTFREREAAVFAVALAAGNAHFQRYGVPDAEGSRGYGRSDGCYQTR